MTVPPLAAAAGPPHADVPFQMWTYNSESNNGTAEMPPPEWEKIGMQQFAWVRLRRPMVAGQPLTSFTRAAFAGDIISSSTRWGAAGLRFINADYTVAVSRLPVGRYRNRAGAEPATRCV